MADAFIVGTQQGMQAAQEGRRAVLDERQAVLQEKEARERELDRQVDRRHKTLLADDLEIEGRIRKDQATRYIEAEGNWAKFEEAVKTIDWSNPEAPKQYEAISASYMPGMFKHESVTRKFNGYDKAVKDSMKYSAVKMVETAGASALNEAARIAPELVANLPKNPDGSVNWIAFSDALEAKRTKLRVEAEQHAAKLRQITADAYTARAGQTRRATQQTAPKAPTLGDAEKGMLAGELKLLAEVRSRLLEIDEKGQRAAQADRYLRLQNEERRIRKRIGALRATATAAGDTPTPEAEPVPATPDGQDEPDPLNLFSDEP